MLQHLQRLDLSLNPGWRCLVPSQEVTYRGVRIDSSACGRLLLWRGLIRCWPASTVFRLGQSVMVRECRLLVAVSPLVPLGPLHVRPVQQWFGGYGFRPWLHGHRHLLVTWRCLYAPWSAGAPGPTSGVGFHSSGGAPGVCLHGPLLFGMGCCPPGHAGSWLLGAALDGPARAGAPGGLPGPSGFHA